MGNCEPASRGICEHCEPCELASKTSCELASSEGRLPTGSRCWCEAPGGGALGGGGKQPTKWVASEACKCEALLPVAPSKLRLLIATGNAPLAQLRSNLLLLLFYSVPFVPFTLGATARSRRLLCNTMSYSECCSFFLQKKSVSGEATHTH